MGQCDKIIHLAFTLSSLAYMQNKDLHLYFRYIDSKISLLPLKFQALAIFCDDTAWFVSDLVGNPGDMLSCNETQMYHIQSHELA